MFGFCLCKYSFKQRQCRKSRPSRRAKVKSLVVCEGWTDDPPNTILSFTVKIGAPTRTHAHGGGGGGRRAVDKVAFSLRGESKQK